MPFDVRGIPQLSEPPLAFRFSVTFLHFGGIPNPIDIRFKNISGIGVTLTEKPVEEGSRSSTIKNLPNALTYEKLVLERGVMLASPLSIIVEDALTDMKINPSNILVSVLNDVFVPLKTWMFQDAYPVAWSISGIDAENNGVLMEKIELVYSRFKTLSL